MVAASRSFVGAILFCCSARAFGSDCQLSSVARMEPFSSKTPKLGSARGLLIPAELREGPMALMTTVELSFAPTMKPPMSGDPNGVSTYPRALMLARLDRVDGDS